MAAFPLLTLLAACGAGAPGQPASGVDAGPNGQWTYADGPHGEHCLFFEYGDRVSNSHALAMDCDTVKP